MTSRSLARVSELAEAMFARLLNLVDDYGRYDGDAEILAAHLYPRRRSVTAEMVEDRLQELVNADGPGEGPVVLYEVDGRRYLQLVKWEEHRGKQKRAARSRWPAPPDPQGPQDPHGDPRESPELHGDPRIPQRGDEVTGCRGDEVSGKDQDHGPAAPAPARESPEGNGPIAKARDGPKRECHPETWRLAQLLCSELIAHVPHWTPPGSLSAWATEFDRMLRLDGPHRSGIPPNEIERVIRWVVRDDFESANVQSAGKLRKRFAQLAAKANGARASPRPSKLEYIAENLRKSEERDRERQREKREAKSAGNALRVVPERAGGV